MDEGTQYTKDYYAGTLSVDSTGGEYQFMAAVNLPHGATITEFSMNGTDNDGTYQFAGFLRYRPYSTTSWITLSTLSTGFAFSAGYINASDTVLSHTVNNASNVYYVTYLQRGGVDQSLYGFKITYTY